MPSVAWITEDPTEVLVIATLHWPFTSVVQGFGLNETDGPLVTERVTISPITGSDGHVGDGNRGGSLRCPVIWNARWRDA